MTIQECYAAIGGDYAGIHNRLKNDALISMLVLRFLETTEYSNCEKAIQGRDWETAFMAAHTLKGMALNLSFTTLAEATSKLTELLRPRNVSDPAEAENLFSAVKAEFNHTCQVLEEFKSSK